MTTNWMRALTVLWPEPGGREEKVRIELTGLEFVEFAHIREVEKQEILKNATSNGKIITITISGPGSRLILQSDIERLKQDIKEIEKVGGDRYGALKLYEAKKLLAKLVLAAK